ncbi:MAG: gliding motility protein GldC [Flavobacteriales bacterium]|jgi:gliding motility-associated protein GldC|nr:gliding motility protein GldC [Flavobacteriales bacterium]NCG29028.1 gliding motility protein GldC [Bacteroidota bacterium]MBT3963089.1 gliding motility protein GldC [Flavobacteriales bacterium]MBT4705985.1 gliding motility protein GldC [Flavobacteriales bacterium]MBT4931493.1 gliding motility protein GldC [Flavobacteriales bacterium]
MKESEIKVILGMDENNVPETLTWEASDGDGKGECDAAFLTFWDKNEKNTLRIDLWTKNMVVDDMKIYFHQMLLSMSETYMRATGDQEISDEMKNFGLEIGGKMGILKPKED